MYRLYYVHYRTIKLMHNPLIMGEGITFEGEPEYSTNDLSDAINALKNLYNKEFYMEDIQRGKMFSLFYIIDDDYNIIATTDFDGTVLMNNNNNNNN